MRMVDYVEETRRSPATATFLDDEEQTWLVELRGLVETERNVAAEVVARQLSSRPAAPKRGRPPANPVQVVELDRRSRSITADTRAGVISSWLTCLMLLRSKGIDEAWKKGW